MPAQQRVGGDDRGHVAQDAAAQHVGQRGQTSSIGVSQPKAPPAQLAVQQAILCNQVGDRVSLVTVQPVTTINNIRNAETPITGASLSHRRRSRGRSSRGTLGCERTRQESARIASSAWALAAKSDSGNE